MTLSTPFTKALSIEHPIALAPMGGTAGGALAAAVSNAGGLGLVGGGLGYPDRVERELPIVAARTRKPWGIGFIAWSVTTQVLVRALEFQPAAVCLAFGDPGPHAPLIHDSGSKLIVQVTSLDEARRARDVGAHVIVAQGTEAGGHGAGRSTLPFVPAVVDLVAPTPVLAAGGIADGRGLAAALVLGASGALLGTRFVATTESISTPAETDAILRGSGDDTVRSRLIDVAIDAPWPSPYTIRTLRNEFVDRWTGREDQLRDDTAAKQAFSDALAGGNREAQMHTPGFDAGIVPVAAGEAVDLITEVSPAADVIASIVAGAEAALARWR
jgi:nitronate monooxygenase